MFDKIDKPRIAALEARLAALEEHNRTHCTACGRIESDRQFTAAAARSPESQRQAAEHQARLKKIRETPRVRLTVPRPTGNVRFGDVALYGITVDGRTGDTADVGRRGLAFEPVLIGEGCADVWSKAYFDRRRAADARLQKAVADGRLIVTDVDPSDLTPAAM
jgi:hypothetical protein